MQFLILSLLVAAASATYSYDYSYPHSYALDSYGGSLYGGYGDSYGYSNLGSGVSYLLGGHGSSHYTAPRIHFIRYIPSHTAKVLPSGGKIDFVMGSAVADREKGIKSTQKGSSSTSHQNPPPWISTKGGTSQSKISSASKTGDSTKGHVSADSAQTPIPSRKPFIPKTTKAPAQVTSSVTNDVTTDFPDDYFDEEVDFLEEEPEDEIAETPIRPEPMLPEKSQSSLMDDDDNSNVKNAFVPAPSNNKEKMNPNSSGSSQRKSNPDADSTRKTLHDSSSNAGYVKTSNAASSMPQEHRASSKKEDPPRGTFSPVPDMDYDDFGSSNNPGNSDDSKKHASGGFNGNRKANIPEPSTFPKQTVYNKRPLAVQLMPQTLPVLTSSAVVPSVIVENPVVGYYYENHQPPAITYQYGIPLDIVVN